MKRPNARENEYCPKEEKYLRSRQRRREDRRIEATEKLEFLDGLADDFVEMFLEEAFGTPTPKEECSFDQRIVELATECQFQEDWMFGERLSGYHGENFHFQLCLVFDETKGEEGWRRAVVTGPKDPSWAFLDELDNNE